jgi:hypothetical protein
MIHLALMAALLLPPANAPFDYQIGDPYPLPAGVQVVSRDWFDAKPAPGAYNICYVNAFQTQDEIPGVNRPDEHHAWPQRLVLNRLGDDPNWGGEFLVDISTARKRRRAADWLEPMIRTCARKGFDAVEYDNLDSWTRFDGTPLAGKVPFGKKEAILFAARITRRAHALGLAVAQKNTVELTRAQARGHIGFDFAIAEECGVYHECDGYEKVYGDRFFSIEYTRKGFRSACRAVGAKVSVVLRDLNVTAPGSKTYKYDRC